MCLERLVVCMKALYWVEFVVMKDQADNGQSEAGPTTNFNSRRRWLRGVVDEGIVGPVHVLFNWMGSVISRVGGGGSS